MPLGDCWMLDLGGQYRARYMDEQNIRGLDLTGNDDDFLLHRTRLFAQRQATATGSASTANTSTPRATTSSSRRG